MAVGETDKRVADVTGVLVTVAFGVLVARGCGVNDGGGGFVTVTVFVGNGFGVLVGGTGVRVGVFVDVGVDVAVLVGVFVLVGVAV